MLIYVFFKLCKFDFVLKSDFSETSEKFLLFVGFFFASVAINCPILFQYEFEFIGWIFYFGEGIYINICILYIFCQ